MAYTLGEIAQYLNADVIGDEKTIINGLATLVQASEGQLSFLANMAYKDQLQHTNASAVIVHPKQAADCQCAALVLDNPYLGYAKVSQLFNTLPKASGVIHPSAVVSPSASIADGVSIAANAVIEDHAVIGAGVIIGAGSVVGVNARVGTNTRLHHHVSIYHDVTIGDECIIHSGVVIGSDGFGFANEKGQWVKICQIGGVVVGDQVEIGANTTIDRGAMSDTIIGDGVKLDNQIQIAHNVEIGAHTAMAAGCMIAGSTKIGNGCTLAGGVGVAGHLQLADGTHVTAMTLVTKSITESGSYSSGTAMSVTSEWRKSAARFRQLDDMAKRIKLIEKSLKE
ncbi:MAG: UDP-3-O-[3-hydroxymyristoyl] glucosamine N-acyltransferase [Oceanicoccus sp.]|jgi:UDP-3-O-[3-hydroxymyristoyl] glucosamine N-acyltransferase